MEKEREKFLKIYANLPLTLRGEIVAILDGEPITWNSAYIEIDNDTKKGKEILDKLNRLGILP